MKEVDQKKIRKHATQIREHARAIKALLDPPPPPPPPVKPKLPDELTVRALRRKFKRPIIISPILDPGSGILRLTPDEEAHINKAHLNRVVEGRLGNADRFFAFGGWEPKTLKKIFHPYERAANGLYELREENEEHFNTLERRIGERADRQITSIIDLIDNCSMHTYPNGFWAAHPWNGDNNVNGTSPIQEMVYHFYEWMNEPGAKETGFYEEDFIRSIVRRFDKKFDPFIIWGIGNEVGAGDGWNHMWREVLKDEGVEPNWRVMTSLGYDDFYLKPMHLYLNYSMHGIQTIEKFEEKKNFLQSGVKMLASEDGEKPLFADIDQYKDLVYHILKDGHFGFEGNERSDWYQTSVGAYDPNKWNWEMIQKVADGWHQFLEEN